MIGCDFVVAGSADAAAACDASRTKGVVNTHLVPLARVRQDPQWELPASSYLEALQATTAVASDDCFNATAAAERLFGNAMLANVMLLGAAYQKGLIPLDAAALLRAIELNGVSVAPNRRAFLWGRIAAADRRAFAEAAAADTPAMAFPQTFEQIVAHRQAHLTAYHDRAYAQAFRDFVDRVAGREREIAPATYDLAIAVSAGLSKLMAYKDAYEVARLFVDPQFRREIDAQFAGGYRLKFNFAPPLARRPTRSARLARSSSADGCGSCCEGLRS